MSAFPCDKSNLCVPCPDGVNGNLSSEAPDNPDFFSLGFYGGPGRPGSPKLNAPPDDYVFPFGPRPCFAPTQQEADDCALHTIQTQVWPHNTTQYGNEAQTCTVQCPDGFDSLPYTVPANTFFSRVSQAEANALALSYCKNRAFEARQCGPLAITLDATEVGGTTALLNGTVNANNVDTFAYFEWGLTDAYGNFSPIQGPFNTAFDSAMTQALAGLASGTTYHYRIVAINAYASDFGDDKSFTTEIMCPAPLFWDLGEGGATQYSLSRLNGYATNVDGSGNLNRLANGVQGNAININRDSALSGFTGIQAANLVTASGPFFVPGDVGRTLYWQIDLVRYIITGYISPTQVTVDTADVIGAQAFNIQAYSIGGAIGAAFINSSGDIVTDDSGNSVLFPFATPGVPTTLVASTPIRINDAGNVFAINGSFYYKTGGSAALGFGAFNFAVIPKISRNSNRIMNNAAGLNVPGEHIKIWLDGVVTNVDPNPLPPPPSIGQQTANGFAYSSNGTCCMRVRCQDPDHPASTRHFYFITDINGFSVQFSPSILIGSPGTMRDINDDKIAVGSCFGDNAGTFDVPCFYLPDGSINPIQLLPGNTQGEASCINANGTIVGFMRDVGGTVYTAFIEDNGNTYDLNDYIPQSFKDMGYRAELGDLISDDNYVLVRCRINNAGSYLACVICIDEI